MNLLEKMKSGNGFTESELQIVNYLLTNSWNKLTIGELAAATYSSNATIVRFCRKLGFTGYRDFYMEFIKQLESKKYVSEEVDYNIPFTETEKTHDIILKMTNLYRESTDLLSKEIDEKMIEATAQVLLKSRRIFIYAIGDSMITARAFVNKLHKIGIFSILANKENEDLTASYNATSEDCAIFLSYRLKLPEYVNDFRLLQKKRVPIIAITANEKHVICRNASYKIIVPNKENDFSIAPFYSQFAFEYITNILYASVYSLNYIQHKARKQDIDSMGM